MDISIGMKRERVRQLGEELLLAAESEHVDLTIYAKGNAAHVGEVIININNYDMERPDLAVGDVFVEVDE